MVFFSLEELLRLRTVNVNFNIGVYKHLLERIPGEEQSLEKTIVMNIDSIKN